MKNYPQQRIPHITEPDFDRELWDPIMKEAIAFLKSYAETEYLQDEISEALWFRLVQCVLDLETAIFGK